MSAAGSTFRAAMIQMRAGTHPHGQSRDCRAADRRGQSKPAPITC